MQSPFLVRCLRGIVDIHPHTVETLKPFILFPSSCVECCGGTGAHKGFVLSLPGVTFPSRSQGGAQQFRLVCSGVHSVPSVLVVVPFQGQSEGRKVRAHIQYSGSLGWCCTPNSQGGLSLVNQETNHNTPAAEEDLLLPPD